MVGRAVVPHLLEHGYQVRGFDRVAPKYVLEDFHIGDQTIKSDVDLAARGCDMVVHLGAIPWNTPPFGRLMDINLCGTFGVLGAALANKMTHVVCASSVRAAGLLSVPPTPLEALPYHETMLATPSDFYGMGKLMSEQLCRGYWRRCPEMSIRCIRPGRIWHGDTPLYAPFLDSMVHQDDVADAVRRCLESEPGYGVYHISAAHRYTETGERMTPDEILKELVDNGADPAIANHRYLSGEMGVYDIAAAERDLGWSTRW